MVEGLIGKKIGMSQHFDEAGNVVPVTVVKAGPCTVVQKKTEQKDGYIAVQLGFVETKEVKRPTKAMLGHFKKSGIPPLKALKEFRFAENADLKEGDQFFVDVFQAGEKVDVAGTSKGKGFASVIKRYGFKGGKASHGSMFHRRPGSIGASAFPSKVVKGKKMPGRMGHERVTVKNLTIIEADKENNLLLIKGAIPGPNGGYVLIKKADFDPKDVRYELKREDKKEFAEEKKREPQKQEKSESNKEEKKKETKEEEEQKTEEVKKESVEEEKKEEEKENG